jgi:SAM-dependent methyltransferase
MSIWNQRYQGEEFHFGKEPNAFLVSHRALFTAGARCLAVADGEGRNGIWLAQQGLAVLAVDNSTVALAKARGYAAEVGVNLQFECADLLNWDWGEARYDVVVAIFIQFAPPQLREPLFDAMKKSLKSGGLLLMQGYTPRQLDYRTGGPSQVENLYTAELLRTAFADMDIRELREHDSVLCEGQGHNGMSALIDLVAVKR